MKYVFNVFADEWFDLQNGIKDSYIAKHNSLSAMGIARSLRITLYTVSTWNSICAKRSVFFFHSICGDVRNFVAVEKFMSKWNYVKSIKTMESNRLHHPNRKVKRLSRMGDVTVIHFADVNNTEMKTISVMLSSSSTISSGSTAIFRFEHQIIRFCFSSVFLSLNFLNQVETHKFSPFLYSRCSSSLAVREAFSTDNNPIVWLTNFLTPKWNNETCIFGLHREIKTNLATGLMTRKWWSKVAHCDIQVRTAA